MAGSCTWWVQRRMMEKCPVYQIQLYELYNRLHKCDLPKGFLLTLSQNGFTSGIPIHQRVLQINGPSSGVNPLHTLANTASFQGTPAEVLGISAKNLTCWSVGCCWESSTCSWDTHEVPPLQPLSPQLCSEDHLEHRDLIYVYRIHCLCSNWSHISQWGVLSSSCGHHWNTLHWNPWVCKTFLLVTSKILLGADRKPSGLGEWLNSSGPQLMQFPEQQPWHQAGREWLC